MGVLGIYFTWKREKRIRELKRSFKSCGEKVLIHYSCRFNHNENIAFKDNIMIHHDCSFSGHGGISIGEGVVFAHSVDVFSGEHNYDSDDLEYLPFDERFKCAAVEIGDYVWVGSNVKIMPGVTIGEGAVIGAGAIVTKDIPAGGIAVGNPAHVIRYRNMEKYRELKDQEMSFIKYKR